MTLNTQKWQLWPKYMLANVGKQGFIDLGDVSDSDVSIHVPRLSLAMVSIQPPLAISFQYRVAWCQFSTKSFERLFWWL